MTVQRLNNEAETKKNNLKYSVSGKHTSTAFVVNKINKTGYKYTVYIHTQI